MLKYPAKFHSAEEGGYWVEFPDLKGCFTQGDTLEEARENDIEALTLWLEVHFERNYHVPEPSTLTGKNVHFITPAPHVLMPILIRKARTAQGLSQKEVSERLGIKYQVYQRFESPRRFNATIKKLEQIAQVLGKNFVVDLVP